MLSDRFRIYFSSVDSVDEDCIPKISLTTEVKAFKKGATVLATSFTTAVNSPLLIFSRTASPAESAEFCESTFAKKDTTKNVRSVIRPIFMTLWAGNTIDDNLESKIKIAPLKLNLNYV